MTNEPKKKKSIIRSAGIVLLKVVLGFIGLLMVLMLLLLTEPVQQLVVGKATGYLKNKLQTELSIGRIYVRFPSSVVVERVYLEDRQNDTLLFLNKLNVDIGMWQLIKGGGIDISAITLKGLNGNIKRDFPDTLFNFQFISDAFASGETLVEDTSSAPLNLSIGAIQLEDVDVRYRDVVTGFDARIQLSHFSTSLNGSDFDKLSIQTGVTLLEGLNAQVLTSVPLADAENENIVQETDKSGLNMPLIKLGDIGLKNINAVYRSPEMNVVLQLEKFLLQTNRIDLTTNVVDLKQLELADALIKLELHATATSLSKTADAVVVKDDAAAPPEWSLLVEKLRLNNNHVIYQDSNVPPSEGMDFANLDITGLTLHADRLSYEDNTISGTIVKGELKDRSGLDLQKFETRFMYGGTEAYLQNLQLKTDRSSIQKHIGVKYPSIAAVTKDINAMVLDVDLERTYIGVKDVLLFAPFLKEQSAFRHAAQTISLHSRIKGRLSDLEIPVLQVSGYGNTKLDMNGSLKGLPDMDKAIIDIRINEIRSTKKDIELLAGKENLPANIALPAQLSLSGRLQAKANNANADLVLQSSLGGVTVKGNAQHISNENDARYDLRFKTESLQLNEILQDTSLGLLSTEFYATGVGYNFADMEASVKGIIHEVDFSRYRYHSIPMELMLNKQNVHFLTAVTDPNIHLSLDATANLSQTYPAVQLIAKIDSIKLQELNLYNEKLIYRGNIELNFPSTNPDSLQGKLFILQSLLVHKDNRIPLDTLQLVAGYDEDKQFLNFSSEVASASLNGKYALTELGYVFQTAIDPYFSLNVDTTLQLKPYSFSLNADISNSRLLRSFVPGLEKLDTVRFASYFTDTAGWMASLNMPELKLGATEVHQLKLNIDADSSKLHYQVDIDDVKVGESIEMYQTRLGGNVQDDNVSFNFNTKDRQEKSKYNIGGSFSIKDSSYYRFALLSDSFQLNYQPWVIAADNYIELTPGSITAHNFDLSQGSQHLVLNSPENAPGSLQVDFKSFKISTLMGFVQPDTSLAKGELNGTVHIADMMEKPLVTGVLDIHRLMVKDALVGDIALKVDQPDADTFDGSITLTGNGNDVDVKARYNLPTEAIEAAIKVNSLPLTTIETLIPDVISNTQGKIQADFNIGGTTAKPVVNGYLLFDQAKLKLDMFNNFFAIDQEKITVTDNGMIGFNNFTIKDTTGNTLAFNGDIRTSDYKLYNLDLTLQAKNFQALNSTRQNNSIFYGKLFFDSNLQIKGTSDAPTVNGRLAINEDTDMSIILPQSEPGIAEREGVIVFVDKSVAYSDSLFVSNAAQYDSLNVSSFQGMDISVDIETHKEADFKLIIDEGNGDYLAVKGRAQLNTGIDPSGKINMSGTYEVEEGSYDMTFNFLHRNFKISKGSRIVWEGEPTDATVDITAVYTATTSPLDLVKNQLGEAAATQRNMYMQQLPFNVLLKMKGELMSPEISFDIQLPEDRNIVANADVINNVKARLMTLKTDEAELNKQVFSLLLLNRFMTENPFESSNSTSTSTLVKQSVSKLMADQLNRMASDLIKGVEVNFDVNATDDYTTGERQSRTDLNVGLSKRMFNDRLTVTVGSNFELEGNRQQNASQRGNNNAMTGNVALDYRLSEDGRYMLRAFRKNEYEGILEGYIIETGVGFSITMDYNRFREIFMKRRFNRRTKNAEKVNAERASINNKTEQNEAE